MTSSENQVRHLYVAGAKKTAKLTSASAKGDVFMFVNELDNTMYYQYMSPGGLTRSDIIPLCNLMSVTFTEADAQKKPARKAVITLNTDMDNNGKADSTEGAGGVPRGTYVVRIIIKNYIGMSDEDFYFKYGQVYSNGAMTTAQFITAMVKSLNDNLSKEAFPLLKVEEGTNSIEITEVEQQYVRGTLARTNVDFTVQLVSNDPDFVPTVDATTKTKMHYEWGDVNTTSTPTFVNSKEIADLEYFLMGERGDVYRGKGWPNTIHTEYLVNPDAEFGYDTLDIHYAFVGSNESVQKSEKTITIVAEKTSATAATCIKEFAQALADAGAKVIKKPATGKAEVMAATATTTTTTTTTATTTTT